MKSESRAIVVRTLFLNENEQEKLFVELVP